MTVQRQAPFDSRSQALPRSSSGAQVGRPGVVLPFLLAFLYLAYSRLPEFLPPSLRLQLILSLAGISYVAFSGRLFELFRTIPGRHFAWLTLWLVVSTAFSVWPGGSLNLLTDQWVKSLLVFPVVAGLLHTPGDLRKVSTTLALAGPTVAVLLLTLGHSGEEGRLYLDQGGTLSNPNDAATLMLVTVPFSWQLATSKGSVARRIIGACGVVLVLVASLKTGSRGGSIAIVGLLVYFFLTASKAGKLRIVALAIAGSAAALVVLPQEILQRYLSIVNEDAGGDDELVAAKGSRENRMELLIQSIKLTAQHPVVGVGPGMFQVASSNDAETEGKKAHWRETHNTYTQISSEAGLPALVLYLAIVWFTFAAAKPSRHAPGSELGTFAQAQFLSMLALAICSFFASFAYHMYLPTLCGISSALLRVTGTDGAQPAPASGQRSFASRAFSPPPRPADAGPAPRPADVSPAPQPADAGTGPRPADVGPATPQDH